MNISRLVNASIAAFALGIVIAMPTQAQTCPCDLSLTGKEVARGFLNCEGNGFGGEDWAGARSISVKKGAKGGKEVGTTKTILSIKDFNPNTGSIEFGDHFCEIASGYPKNGGTPRKLTRASITTFAEWTACRNDLITVITAFSGRLIPDANPPACQDTDGDTIPDRWDSPRIEEPTNVF